MQLIGMWKWKTHFSWHVTLTLEIVPSYRKTMRLVFVDQGNGAVFIGRKTQRSLGAVPAVPDISGGRQAYKGVPSRLRSIFCLFVRNVVSETKYQFSGDAEERVKFIKKLHEEVYKKIVTRNEKYKARVDKQRKHVQFNEGDMVWIHLCKGRFPPGKYAKLKPRADGPFKVLRRIGDNAYKIKLPESYEVSDIFNVIDLSPYYQDSESRDSRTSLLEQWEPDTDASNKFDASNKSESCPIF
ncbi:hypothetical protein Tco_0826489 [Tanacetum coccineum]